MLDLKTLIRDVPDFPKPGIMFRDISPLLAHSQGWAQAIDTLAGQVAALKPDFLAGIDARGFLVAAPLAYKLGVGFCMVRKKGKLPWKTVQHTYDLEYGSDRIELNADAFPAGARVLICDDLLATGGTADAACTLVRKIGGQPIGLACLIELEGLGGRARVGVPVHPLLTY